LGGRLGGIDHVVGRNIDTKTVQLLNVLVHCTGGIIGQEGILQALLIDAIKNPGQITNLVITAPQDAIHIEDKRTDRIFASHIKQL
jgi:hypothetical protein